MNNLANILSVIPFLLPTASDVQVPTEPTELRESEHHFDPIYSGNRDRDPDIVDLSAQGPFLEKSFPDFDALVKFIEQEKTIDLASLHTIIDYVTKNRNDITPLKYYSRDNHDASLQQSFNTNLARSNAEFKNDGINASQLASMISQLFEQEEPTDKFSSLSINQKAAVTAILAQSKGGQIDEELLRAIKRLKAIPLKPLSAQETFSEKSFPDFDALVQYIKEETINLASLHTIIDYVIDNRNEEGQLQYYSGYNHDALLRQSFNTNVARSKAELKSDGIDASQLASKISQLLKPEEPEDTFASLSINQKAAVTAILAQSKGGEIDEEFLRAIERLKDIPLKS